MDDTRGFRVEAIEQDNARRRLFVRRPQRVPLSLNPNSPSFAPNTLRPWELHYDVVDEGDGRETLEKIVVKSTGRDLELPPASDRGGTVWLTPSPAITPEDIRVLSKLKQEGRDHVVTNLLRLINERVSGIELLAPTGARALVFVRLDQDMLLPLSMMGEGRSALSSWQ